MQGNNSANFNTTNDLANDIYNISNNSFSICMWVYTKSGAYNTVFSLGTNDLTLNKNASLILYSDYKHYFSFWLNDCGTVSTFQNDFNNWVH